MAFEDRVVEYPNRVTLTDTDGNVTGPYTITRDEGTVTTEGTPLTAENLNAEIEEAAARAAASATGALTIDSNSNVHVRNIQHGSATVKTSKAKTTTTKHVTFAESFTSTPHVNVTPVSSVPAKISVSVSSVTTTGFDIVLYRSTKARTSVHWIAMI